METGRPATKTRNGMVFSPHALPSEAGVEILKAGGTAVDAQGSAAAAISY